MRPELGLLLEHVLPRPSQGYNKLYCYYDNDDDIDHRSLSHPGWLVLVYIIPRELLLYTPWLLMVFLPFFFLKKKNSWRDTLARLIWNDIFTYYRLQYRFFISSELMETSTVGYLRSSPLPPKREEKR